MYWKTAQVNFGGAIVNYDLLHKLFLLPHVLALFQYFQIFCTVMYNLLHIPAQHFCNNYIRFTCGYDSLYTGITSYRLSDSNLLYIHSYVPWYYISIKTQCVISIFFFHPLLIVLDLGFTMSSCYECVETNSYKYCKHILHPVPPSKT